MENNKQENFTERMKDALNLIEGKLSYLPDNIKNTVIKELDMIKETFIDARAPRFAFVGRRGSGKSSLINAIFSSKVAEVGSVKAKTIIGKWFPYEGKNGAMEILDTRGLNEGSNPEQALDELKSCLDEKLPDAFIFIIKAKEVDSHINADIESLRELHKYVLNNYMYDAPVISVVTQADELDPNSNNIPPFNAQKIKNINEAQEYLKSKLSKFFPKSTLGIAVASYLEWDENKNIVFDKRWNIEKLLELLIEHIPRSAQMELAKIGHIKSLQKSMAKKVVYSAAGICAAVAAEPIPIADLPILTGIQLTMIVGIGYIGGYEMNKQTAREFLTAMGLNIGGAFIFKELARSLSKLLLGWGSLISSGIAFSATIAIGEAAIAYFIDKKSEEESKSIYMNKVKESKNDDKE